MEVYDLEKILKPNLNLLQCFGLWPPDGVLGKNKLYTAYSVFTMICLTALHILSQTIFLGFIYNDLALLATATYYLLVEWVAVLKFYYFLTNFTDIKRLMSISVEVLLLPKNDEEKEVINYAIRIWRVGAIILMGIVMPTVSLWYVVPFSRSTYTLPFSAWYPFEYNYSPVYEITYAYQVISNFTICIANTCLDIFGAGLMSYLSGQCDLLAHKLRNMGKVQNNQFLPIQEGKGLQNLKSAWFTDNPIQQLTKNTVYKMTNSFSTLNHSKTADCQNDLHAELKDNIRHHKLIIQFAQGVSHFFKLNALGVFASSIVAITMTMFQLSMISVGAPEFYLLLVYVIAVFLELLMYCWYGNEVIEKSSKISYAAFESNWTDGSEVFKKDLLYFTMRSQRVIKLTAVDIFELSLQVYVSIVKTAFSYFAVLKQVYRED